MPGHVRPLISLSGGGMMRTGSAEGAVDIVRCAGGGSVAALCTGVGEEGGAAQLAGLKGVGSRYGLPLCFVMDLGCYPYMHETLVQRVSEAPFPLLQGEFKAVVFRNIVDGREHLALIKGNVGGGQPTLVRLHSECLTGDVFASMRCDCGEQLEESVNRILA